MALVIVMSVFNGFSWLLESRLSSFDPDIKITAAEGKMFDPSTLNVSGLRSLPGVVYYAEVLEESAMLKYGNQQVTAVVKGVPQNFAEYTKIDRQMVGNVPFILDDDGLHYAVIGQGIQTSLGIGLTKSQAIHIFVPKKGKQLSSTLISAVNHETIQPSGVFSILDEIDSKYILVPFQFANDLFDSGKKISAIEISIDSKYNLNEIQKQITSLSGNNFTVKNKIQQHDLMYKTMKSEKLMAFGILVIILAIASFNLLGSLSMLIIDKQTDISILRGMGAEKAILKKIFLFEGWLISFLGALIGTIAGVIVCLLQIKFELIKLPGANESFIISAYPVVIVFTDLLLVFSVVLFIGFLFSWYPVRFISRNYSLENNM